MTNSEKLRALADWFDGYDFSSKAFLNHNEVQQDLRTMATEFERYNKEEYEMLKNELKAYIEMHDNFKKRNLRARDIEMILLGMKFFDEKLDIKDAGNIAIATKYYDSIKESKDEFHAIGDGGNVRYTKESCKCNIVEEVKVVRCTQCERIF